MRTVIVPDLAVIGKIHPDTETAIPVEEIVMDIDIAAFIHGNAVILLDHPVIIKF
jgi:hypothetical protein